MDNIKHFILDEGDELLSRGFKHQIHDIFTKMPINVQVTLLTATMPKEMLEVTLELMKDPVRIVILKEALSVEGIKQFYVLVNEEVFCIHYLFDKEIKLILKEWKLETLCEIYQTLPIAHAVIFCNSRTKVDWLTQQMRAKEITVSAVVIYCNQLRNFELNRWLTKLLIYLKAWWYGSKRA